MISLVVFSLAPAGTVSGFDELLRRLASRPLESDALVSAFVAQAGGTPVIAGDEAIFVVRAEPQPPPRLLGDFNGWGEAGPYATRLERLGVTSFFFRKVSLDRGARLEYLIVRDGREELDPLNTRRVDGFAEPHSEVRMPGYVSPPGIELDPRLPRGRVVEFEHDSDALGNRRRVHVYLPPGLEEDERRCPEAWFGDGTVYVERVLVPRVIDDVLEAFFPPASAKGEPAPTG